MRVEDRRDYSLSTSGDKPTIFFGFLSPQSICQRKLEAGMESTTATAFMRKPQRTMQRKDR